MRDAILMIAAMVGKMDDAAIQTQAVKVGMPVALEPLVRAFNDRRIQTDEIIKAWMGTGGTLRD